MRPCWGFVLFLAWMRRCIHPHRKRIGSRMHSQPWARQIGKLPYLSAERKPSSEEPGDVDHSAISCCTSLISQIFNPGRGLAVQSRNLVEGSCLNRDWSFYFVVRASSIHLCRRYCVLSQILCFANTSIYQELVVFAHIPAHTWLWLPAKQALLSRVSLLVLCWRSNLQSCNSVTPEAHFHAGL